MKQWLITILALVSTGLVAAQELPTEIDADRIPETRTGGNCLIRGGNVLTASHGRLDGVDVLVRDGKIVEIGPGLAPDNGMAVIEAAGKYIIPGIIDCHSHMAISGGVNEGTVAITAEVRIADTVRNDDLTIYRALAGGVTTANLLHGSANPIGGQNAVIRLKYKQPVEDMMFPGAPRGVKFALGENPKRSRQRFPNTRMGVEVVIRRAFIEARQYQDEWREYAAQKAKNQSAAPPRRDLRLETLAGIMDGSVLVHAHCYRADEILMLIRIAEEFGFTVGTFQHVLEGYKVAPEIAKHGAGASSFSDWWAYKIEAYDAIPYNAALMTRAGIVTSLNSDSNEMVRRMYHEAAKGMKYGDLSEEEALRLVTLNPALQLGIEDRVGSIDIGKDADLAIFNKHPFSVYTRCEMTLIEGEVFFERRDREIEPRDLGIDPVGIAKKSDDSGIRPASLRDPDPKGPVHAIVGATVHPVSRDPIPDGTVVVRGARIVAVGPRDRVTVPEGATVVQGQGLHVYPGMIDSGTELGLTEIGSVEMTQDSTETGSFNPDLRSWIAVNHDSEIIPVTRVNGITSAMIAPTGGVIAGQCALMHLEGWTREEMVVKAPLSLAVNFPSIPPDRKWQDDKRVTELVDWLERARRYDANVREAKAGGRRGPERDVKLEELAPFAKGERPIVFAANRQKHIVDVVEFALENGLQPIVRGGREAWKVADYLAKKGIPCIIGPVLTTPYSKYDPYDAAFFNASVLHAAGVEFAFQTDDASNSRNLPFHAGMAAAYGLDPDQAYRAVTLSAAEIWGVDEILGSIDEGKIADLIVTDGDPLEFRTKIHSIFIAGRPVSLESKHTRLYERYLERLETHGRTERF